MRIEQTNLPDTYLIHPSVFEDERGYFFESFNQARFKQLSGIEKAFVQDNESKSSYGVIRGLHYQREPYGQSKLVRVVKGEVLDVVVDIRPGSATYGEQLSVLLSEKNKLQLYIPAGFAHGFAVLSNEAIFSYKCDAFYKQEFESGIRVDDPTLNIDWKIPMEKRILSEKDRKYPFFGDHEPYSSI